MRLFQEGNAMVLLVENETPHEYLIPIRHGDVAQHKEHGEVLIQQSDEIGWHYLRKGLAEPGTDFENVGISNEDCLARSAENKTIARKSKM